MSAGRAVCLVRMGADKGSCFNSKASESSNKCFKISVINKLQTHNISFIMPDRSKMVQKIMLFFTFQQVKLDLFYLTR